MEKQDHSKDLLSHLGETGTIKQMRYLLEHDHGMIQMMLGKAQNDSDFIAYISENRDGFAVITSEAGSNQYKISFVGDVFFVHEKNLDRFARAK